MINGSFRVFAHFSLVGLLSVLPVMSFASDTPDAPHISVTGHAQMEVKPDVFHFSAEISDTAGSAAIAKAEVEKRVRAVFAVTDRLRIPRNDTRAADYVIYPEYRYENNERRLLGYRVTRRIAVKLQKLESYADLMNGLVNAGVTQASAARPDVSNRDALQAEVRLLALDDARKKAAALAKRAGTRLGGIYRISEAAAMVPRPMMAAERMMAADSAPVIETGTISLSAQLQVVFYLEETSP
ncbi:MAG: SIMPL domain-containing protein [Gammaproteobacteria bacterium]|nr:SIMPL domain-containing protein [Gammaproteobacteria bacterium]